MDKLITCDVCPENQQFRPNTFPRKTVVPVALKAQVSPNKFSCSPKFHIIRSKTSVYPAGITTAVIVSIERQCPKTGSFKAAIPRWSLGSKKVVVISPGLSQNRSFYLHLTDKGRTTLVQKIEFLVFFCKFSWAKVEPFM